MSTDLSLDPIEIIRLYGLRYKIEVGFKQAVRTIGSYAYHFWMKDMKPLKRYQGKQYLHRKTESYRNQVIRKWGEKIGFLSEMIKAATSTPTSFLFPVASSILSNLLLI